MIRAIVLTVLLAVTCRVSLGAQRFPPPEFESAHQLPATTTPAAEQNFVQYVDLVVLLAALTIASYLALRKR